MATTPTMIMVPANAPTLGRDDNFMMVRFWSKSFSLIEARKFSSRFKGFYKKADLYYPITGFFLKKEGTWVEETITNRIDNDAYEMKWDLDKKTWTWQIVKLSDFHGGYYVYMPSGELRYYIDTVFPKHDVNTTDPPYDDRVGMFPGAWVQTHSGYAGEEFFLGPIPPQQSTQYPIVGDMEQPNAPFTRLYEIRETDPTYYRVAEGLKVEFLRVGVEASQARYFTSSLLGWYRFADLFYPIIGIYTQTKDGVFHKVNRNSTTINLAYEIVPGNKWRTYNISDRTSWYQTNNLGEVSRHLVKEKTVGNDVADFLDKAATTASEFASNIAKATVEWYRKYWGFFVDTFKGPVLDLINVALDAIAKLLGIDVDTLKTILIATGVIIGGVFVIYVVKEVKYIVT